MKNKKIWIPVFATALVTVSLLLVFLNTPSDSIISPYLNEPIIPLVDENIDQEFASTSIFDWTIEDSVILPDNSIISGGQVLSDRNMYVPALKRTNLGGGALWTTIINPVLLDGVNYDPYGTSDNTIQHIIYVNPELIYVIGSMRARLYNTTDDQYPLSGFFANENVPIGDDLLVFVASFTDDFDNLKLHGFITPPGEEGSQQTIVADATLLDANTFVLTGITNSHEGLFESAPEKSIFDFVLSVEVNDTLAFNHLFTFDNSSYAQPNKVYSLANGDLIVSGGFEEADGDFADIPLTQSVESPAFVARIDGDTFNLDWVSSNLLKNTMTPAVTQFLNVLELDNHRLVTIANVWEANETYDKSILLTVFTSGGSIQTQKVVDLGGREVYATQLFKATTGYWIVGAIEDGLTDNIMLVKITASLSVDFIYEILGTGEEVVLGDAFLQTDGTWILPIRTYSKDQDYGFLSSQTDTFFNVFIKLS